MTMIEVADKPVLYHFWSDTASQRIRLALGYKKIDYIDKPLSYWDDETFFDLGIARKVPVLKVPDAPLLTDVNAILWDVDKIFPNSNLMVDGIIDSAAWSALLDWRANVDAVLTRMMAPALLGYSDIATNEQSIKAYKREIKNKYQMSAEALANDRYAAYDQLVKMTNLKALGYHLSANKFYMGEISVADVLLTADLYPLQCLDGVSLPIDVLYYLARVEKECNVDLQQGLKARL